MNKKLTFWLLALVMVIGSLMAGCASQTPAASASAAASAEASAPASSADNAGSGSTLSIMWWGADERHTATLAALDAYTKKTGIQFKAEYTAWDGYWTKLPTLVASNSLPDVLQMDGAYISDYVSKGVLADLSDVDLVGTVPDKVLENIKIDGKMYGVPLSHNAQGMAYNIKALEQYGIIAPTAGWTYDQYWAFAEECRSKLPDDKWGVAFDGTLWDSYQYYQTANGKGPIFSEDGKSYTIDKDLWMTFYNKQVEFAKNNVVPPAEIQAAFKENDAQADQMASGKVMTRGATVGSVSALEALMPGSVGVVTMPTGTAGGGWAQSTIFFSASASSQNLDAGKEFMKWFISDLDAGKILGTTRGIPISEDVYKSIESTMTAGSVLGKELLNTCMDKALPFYAAAPNWQDFTAGYKTEIENLMFGSVTVEQAYDNIIKLADQVKAQVQ